MDESEVKRIEQDAEQRAVWLNNLYICRERWKQVPPERVARDLWSIGCGTVGCLYGHMTAWPEFNVRQTPTEDLLKMTSESLFGAFSAWSGSHHGMFSIRSFSEGPGTDHDIVTRRIEKRIRELEEGR